MSLVPEGSFLIPFPICAHQQAYPPNGKGGTRRGRSKTTTVGGHRHPGTKRIVPPGMPRFLSQSFRRGQDGGHGWPMDGLLVAWRIASARIDLRYAKVRRSDTARHPAIASRPSFHAFRSHIGGTDIKLTIMIAQMYYKQPSPANISVYVLDGRPPLYIFRCPTPSPFKSRKVSIIRSRIITAAQGANQGHIDQSSFPFPEFKQRV